MFRNWLIINLFIFTILSACGGGEEYKERGFPSQASSSECLKCHGTDIEDTHYDNPASAPIEGYVLDFENLDRNADNNFWSPEGMGYVLKTGTNACYASCHDYHNTDMKIERQFFRSDHSDITKKAFTLDFSSPSQGFCLRCHSGIGYASYVDTSNSIYPDWNAPSTDIAAHHLTCNSCHDAQGYPSKDNKRLRKSGDVRLVSGSGNTIVYDAVIKGAGPSATCITCHQARESGWSLYKAITYKGADPYDDNDHTINEQVFLSPHHYLAGAMLFSLKGFEFKGFMLGKNFSGKYSSGIFQHQVLSCTGCHMADSGSEDLGGHTFNLEHRNKKHLDLCKQCHPGISDFNVYGRKEILEQLKNKIITELSGRGIYYNPKKEPYFFTTNDPDLQGSDINYWVTDWKESELIAAFNLHFVNREPGAHVHNFPYAAQILYDSCIALGITPPIPRPSRNDRDAMVYN
ncbi:MAG: hypothetical protein N2257_07410 [Thermodesulfovibrionales bacterium]|nr:hypothetical protein [Thermodesulfovibrionales bacterium]